MPDRDRDYTLVDLGDPKELNDEEIKQAGRALFDEISEDDEDEG